MSKESLSWQHGNTLDRLKSLPKFMKQSELEYDLASKAHTIMCDAELLGIEALKELSAIYTQEMKFQENRDKETYDSFAEKADNVDELISMLELLIDPSKKADISEPHQRHEYGRDASDEEPEVTLEELTEQSSAGLRQLTQRSIINNRRLEDWSAQNIVAGIDDQWSGGYDPIVYTPDLNIALNDMNINRANAVFYSDNEVSTFAQTSTTNEQGETVTSTVRNNEAPVITYRRGSRRTYGQ